MFLIILFEGLSVSMLTIILFFVYTYGLGYSISFFLKNSDNFFERNLMRVGFGLAVIPLFGVILNLLHIPIDWRIVLLVSLAMPLYGVFKSMKSIKLPALKLTKSNITVILVLIMFFLTLFMYVTGAFKYPYLEDDDPWTHAVSIKYVALEKNVKDTNNVFRYIDPYPPGFDIVFGLLHQTSASLMWTMKFFNALIISLGIIFFYFFSKEFIGNKNKALFSTAVLVMIPCYLSHFIWAHSLIVTLFFPLMYSFLMINKDTRWKYASALIYAGLLLVQPDQAIKLSIMLGLYIFVNSILRKKIQWSSLFSFIVGISLSLLWWYNKLIKMINLQGKKELIFKVEGSNLFTRIIGKLAKTFPSNSGTATRAYNFNDYFFAKSQNLINNPVGVGVVLCILLFITLIFVVARYKSLAEEKNHWVVVALVWLLFTFIGMNTVTFHLPVGLIAFRVWMLFAIPVSLLVCEGAWFLAHLLKQLNIPMMVTFFLLLIGIFFTSAIQKYKVNTAVWGPGQSWTSMDEIMGYVWLKNLPADTKVFAYSGDEFVIGFDKFSCLWCDDVIEFRKNLLYSNASEVYSWLKRNGYEYLIIGGMAYKHLGGTFGINETNNILPKRLEEISSLGKFQVAHQTKGMVLFKIV